MPHYQAWRNMADILRPEEARAAGRPAQTFEAYPGWHLADGWETGRLIESQSGPFAVTMAKNRHLVVLMRGSTTDEDWAANFNYPFCANESAAAIGIPGRVHQGFLEYLIAIAPLLDAEVERIKPRRISLAGDSVGGAVSVITGAYLARKYASGLDSKVEVIAIGKAKGASAELLFPQVPVKRLQILQHRPCLLLTFMLSGTPRVGDDVFSSFFREHVNGRSPAFLGSGIRFRGKAVGFNMVWEIGDFVVQVPWDCFPVPDCVGGSTETYMYSYHGGLIKITPRMMPNEDGWMEEANWLGDFKIGFKGMVATHMCSYWCW
ncbi:lipase-like protein [Nannochloropsis gaditana]|uniref:Lipase-like protein n=1 Tax=Nannochloropsis gaditana TaxID=72520 RepID=W7TW60_9STRA|nr:lipase-like protein [Nannochloropsis gaditana]